MKYISCVNALFRSEIEKFEQFVVYGQNVSTGSSLGGLAVGFSDCTNCSVFNVPNTENALVGMGFGLMLSGISSAYFMKQQDFLLLGIDHLTNTYNYIRQQQPSASFSIVNITMDAGYEGIQSSLNNLADFCAIANCEAYTISSKQEAEAVIGGVFGKPGFRIVSVSQRLFGTEILDFESGTVAHDDMVFGYRQGLNLTVACFNFSLPQGNLLCNQLGELGVEASLYGVAATHSCNYKMIVDDAIRTGRLVIIDDSKSLASMSCRLEIEALRAGVEVVYAVKRKVTEDSYRPNSEIFDVDVTTVLNQLKLVR